MGGEVGTADYCSFFRAVRVGPCGLRRENRKQLWQEILTAKESQVAQNEMKGQNSDFAKETYVICTRNTAGKR